MSFEKVRITPTDERRKGWTVSKEIAEKMFRLKNLDFLRLEKGYMIESFRDRYGSVILSMEVEK